MKVLAVYPGRFQPFHKGHAQVYQWLKDKFGNAAIATSDKVEAPKSPFNFSEKKKMMELAGVISNDIHQVVNPYIAKEILKDYDPKKTVLVFAVSEKDMAEDPRFSFKPTKSGKPGYLQPYKGNEKKLKPFGDVDKPTGYVVVTPTFTFDVLGKPAKSATELRKQFVTLDNEKQKDFVKDLFGKYSAPIHKLMAKKIGEMTTKPKSVKQLKEEMRGINIGMALSRALMPQVGASYVFAEYLKNNSIKSSKQSIDPNSLKSSQMEFDRNKVNSMIDQKSDNPIVVSNDDYVLDGHHRWLADKMDNRQCDAYRVDLPILELIRVAKEYENKTNGKLDEELSRKELAPKLDSFVSFASEKLGIKTAPKVRFKTEDDEYNSFAAYNPAMNELSVMTKNRHPMDIFRSVAHELVHHKQNEEGRIKDVAKEGATGSPIENEANAEAGRIMRWYANINPKEFDLSFVSEETLTEGIYDPNIFKAVFLAGGPGSGKDYIMKKTMLSDPHLGLTEINSDVAFEFLMKKEGLDFKMPESEKAQRDIVRGRAKMTTKEKERLALAGRLGLIINGTADDFAKMERIKKQLELLGYETMMVFVNTSDEVSKERNILRGRSGSREVPEVIRQEKWKFAQENVGHFQKLFGMNRFVIIDNSQDINLADPMTKKYLQDNLTRVSKIIKSFVSSKVDNNASRTWIERQKTKRGIQEMANIKEAEQEVAMSKTSKKDLQSLSTAKKPNVNINKQFESYIENSSNREIGTPSLTKIYADMTPGQSVPAPEAPIMEKKKLVFKKKVAQEERSPVPTLPNADGIGPEITQYRPFTVTGFTYGLSESIEAWANSPKTQRKFFDKYGDLAEAKLIDAAKKLQETGCGSEMPKPKSMKEMRELAGMKQGISGNVYKDGDLDEEDAVKPTGTVKGYKKLVHPQSTFEKKVNKSLEEETPAWQRKEGKSEAGGLNRKGIASYRRANPGSKLSMAVTTEPSKLKKGSKAAKRRLSFCRRMKGMKKKLTSAKTARDPDSRINKSLRKWNCEE